MAAVFDILARKGDQIHSIDAQSTVLDATRKMNQHKLGALLVMRNEQLVGIFTERDVLRRVVAAELNPAEARVGDVMTADVLTVRPETDLDDVSRTMQQRRIRHLPVTDGFGRVQGLVSLGDLNAWHVSTQQMQIEYLNQYIHGMM